MSCCKGDRPVLCNGPNLVPRCLILVNRHVADQSKNSYYKQVSTNLAALNHRACRIGSSNPRWHFSLARPPIAWQSIAHRHNKYLCPGRKRLRNRVIGAGLSPSTCISTDDKRTAMQRLPEVTNGWYSYAGGEMNKIYVHLDLAPLRAVVEKLPTIK
jgi:hypothetical protein